MLWSPYYIQTQEFVTSRIVPRTSETLLGMKTFQKLYLVR